MTRHPKAVHPISRTRTISRLFPPTPSTWIAIRPRRSSRHTSARGLEILAQNEQVTNSLAVDFKPDEKDGKSTLNPKAKAMMDAAHAAAAKLKEVMQRSGIDRDLSLMDTNKAWKGITGEMAFGGKSQPIWTWREELTKRREGMHEREASGDARLASSSPSSSRRNARRRRT